MHPGTSNIPRTTKKKINKIHKIAEREKQDQRRRQCLQTAIIEIFL